MLFRPTISNSIPRCRGGRDGDGPARRVEDSRAVAAGVVGIGRFVRGDYRSLP
ncbi:ORFL76C [Human betaherpesvirus 5]|nr:ORFL76C [Human betaherpesvirus 5]QHX40384.1 ORFL76C [Human betaherpesvirus 5]